MFRNVLFVYTFVCLIFTKTLLCVRSDSASGCCAYWYGATNDCSLCTSSGICRDSIGNSISGAYTSTGGSTDCISFTVSEADCVSNGGIFLHHRIIMGSVAQQTLRTLRWPVARFLATSKLLLATTPCPLNVWLGQPFLTDLNAH